MHVPFGRWRNLELPGRHWKRLPIWALFAAGWAMHPVAAQQPAPQRPGQAQAASQFLRAVLRANYVGAYARLAPEVRQTVRYGRFVAAARPLWQTGQRRGAAIELYKLGMRLSDRSASRLFYDFSFTTDSSLKTPAVLLEVTFRDTATRAVLGFGLRPTRAAKNGLANPLKK